MVTAHETPSLFGAQWRADWRATLGPAWGVLLAGFLVCLFIGGATMPLWDPDLPMHLALGEWIVRHRAVPFVEPFAWTRAGEPFFAYSWLMEVLYYGSLRALGPLGPHLIQGLQLALAGVGVLVLGAVARWSGWTTILVLALHILIGVGVVPSLRPQGVMVAVGPFTWAFVLLVRDRARIVAPLFGLFACAAVAANSHLFFPMTAAPGVALLLGKRLDWRRIALAAAAVLVGWMCSPYALHWLDVYRLNFEPHALYTSPTPVEEYTPGFTALIHGGGTMLLVVPLLIVLPWLVTTRLTGRERAAYGLLWFAGLVAFGIAVRGVLPWWLLSMPAVAVALGVLVSPTTPLVLTTQRTVVAAIFGAVAAFGGGVSGDPWLAAGTVETRYLPSTAASGIEPIARWLDCHLAPAARGRLLTIFNYGSYVAWRLPHLSQSIDGRTIFPDSAARAETYLLPVRRTLPLPPWRSADLAIVPVPYPVAAVLDTATGWRRVAMTADRDGPATMIGLWVKESWWANAGSEGLPSRQLLLMHTPPDATRGCAGRRATS